MDSRQKIVTVFDGGDALFRGRKRVRALVLKLLLFDQQLSSL